MVAVYTDGNSNSNVYTMSITYTVKESSLMLTDRQTERQTGRSRFSLPAWLDNSSRGEREKEREKYIRLKHTFQ